jgi:transposase-like protein
LIWRAQNSFAGSASSVSIPKCPICHRKISFFESFRARMRGFICPTCGYRLRVPKGSVGAAIALYLVFWHIHDSGMSFTAQIAVILSIAAAVTWLEYHCINYVAASRADKTEKRN